MERRQIPVLALTLAREGRLGRDLRPSSVDCQGVERLGKPLDEKVTEMCRIPVRRDSRQVRLHESGSLSTFARRVQQYLDRPVQDATGLAGLLEWDVTFAVDRNPAADSELLPLETALQEQLGLRLVPRTAPLEVRVIDSVAKPTED